MATYVGKVGEFDSSKETFKSYCDRMDMFFEANDLVVLGGAANAVADAAVVRKKRAIFLTEIGADSFTLVNDLLAPRSAKEVELKEITRVLKEHYNPAPLEIAESFHFGTRVRKEGESIADFTVALKKLSIHCNFGVYLNRALRDRFVCGLNHEKIQNRLLNTADLTFKLACETARAMEMAAQQAKEFVPGSAVHKVDKQQPWKRQGDTRGNEQRNGDTRGNEQGNTQDNAQSKSRERCRHCNSVKHQPSDCSWQDAICYKCQQQGHIVPACKTSVPYKDKKGKTHVLEDEVQEDSSQGYSTSSGSTYNMFSITTGRGSPPWKVTVCVNGVNLEMEVDSGATFSVIGENQLSMWGSPLVIKPSPVKLRTFTGEVIIPKGEAEVKVEYGGQTCRLPLLVTPGKRPALLGRNWLSDLRLNWKELAQQNQVHQVISDTASGKEQFPSLCREEPGNLEGFKAHMDHGSPDCMLRHPAPGLLEESPVPADAVLTLEHLDTTPIISAMVREWTRKDPVLAQVVRLLEEGWPDTVKSEELLPYYHRRTELSLQDGCVLWGARVLIPAPGRASILQELHVTHPGVSRLKALARSYVYWPGIDKDIERLVSDCATCQEHRNVPPSMELHPWEWPDKPWSRLHADFAGPFLGHMFLILVDSHSKWMDIYTMSSITSEATIGNLKASFSTHGLPDVLVTDNGPSFKSESFRQFVSLNGIQHLTSAPYHPASNGLAERAVQTFKNAMKKLSGESVQDRVNRFLFRYRVTPQSMTGHSPAELLFNRRIKCPLDLPRPDLKSKICEKQRALEARHDEKAVNRAFQEGDYVYHRNFSGRGNRNLPGVITENLGGKGFVIWDTTENKVVRRHPDHIFRGGNHGPPADIAETVIQQVPPPPASATDQRQLPQPPAASESPVRDRTPATTPPVRSSQRATKGIPPMKMDL